MTGEGDPTLHGTGGVPGGTGGELNRPGRRLDRAPGERLAGGPSGEPATGAGGSGSAGRAVAMGLVGAGIGIGSFLVLAIPLSVSPGLIVVALFMARFVGLFVRAGAAGSVSSPARVSVAVAIFLAAIAVANVATWLWARHEGGVLGLTAFLDETYGSPLLALEAMLGTLAAWWSAR